MALSQTTFAEDYSFGTQSEEKVVVKLNEFLNTTLERKGGFCVFDFENPTKTIHVELKTRRIAHDRYPTAIIGANKVEACANSPDKKYIFVFAYTDGLFMIEYDKEVFEGMERQDNYTRGYRPDHSNHAQKIVLVPVHLLTKIH
jgi:hypothetical protein